MLKKMLKMKEKKGFTLVELIVVIAILAILAAIAIPAFLGIIKDSNEKADLATASNIVRALEVKVTQGTIKLAAGNTFTDNAATPAEIAQGTDLYAALDLNPPPVAKSQSGDFYVLHDGTKITSVVIGTDAASKNQVWPTIATLS